MDTQEQILVTLGEIKGELLEIRKLSERVNRLEQWHSYVSGAFAVLAAAFTGLLAYFKGSHGQ